MAPSATQYTVLNREATPGIHQRHTGPDTGLESHPLPAFPSRSSFKTRAVDGVNALRSGVGSWSGHSKQPDFASQDTSYAQRNSQGFSICPCLEDHFAISSIANSSQMKSANQRPATFPG